MHKITMRSIQSLILFCIVCVMASCTTSKRTTGQTIDQVERLQNNTEYSAVESEWNELYQ